MHHLLLLYNGIKYQLSKTVNLKNPHLPPHFTPFTPSTPQIFFDSSPFILMTNKRYFQILSVNKYFVFYRLILTYLLYTSLVTKWWIAQNVKIRCIPLRTFRHLKQFLETSNKLTVFLPIVSCINILKINGIYKFLKIQI